MRDDLTVRLKLIRSSVYAAPRMCGFAEEPVENIVLAIDEACQNIIVHGYDGRDDGVIILALFRDPAGILVQLRDFAPLRPGKLGSHFMHEIMDKVELHRML